MLAAACQALLFTALLTAGLIKLADRDRFLRTLAGLPWLSLRVARPAARAIPLLELTVAFMLVLAPRIGAGAGLGLLAAFTAAVGRELAAGRRFRCGCFGGAGTRPVGADALLRNGLLVAAALVILVLPYSFAPPAMVTGFGLGLLLVLYEIGAETLDLARSQ